MTKIKHMIKRKELTIYYKYKHYVLIWFYLDSVEHLSMPQVHKDMLIN